MKTRTVKIPHFLDKKLIFPWKKSSFVDQKSTFHGKIFIFWSKIPIFPNVSHMIFGLHMFHGVKFRKFLKFNLKIESKNIRIFQIVDLTSKTDKTFKFIFRKHQKMNLLTQYIHMVGLEFLIEWIFDENSLFYLKNTICSNFSSS